MARNSQLRSAGIGTSAMADIAFLLLCFFLMTTVIRSDQGLMMKLSEWRDEPVTINQHDRNVFAVHINSQDAVMVENELSQIEGLRTRVRDFILNNGRDKQSSDSPEAAIISLKADRGTTHRVFINALDEIQAAYNEIYASRAGLTTEQYMRLDPANPAHKAIIEKARDGVPMNISLAEPSR